MEMFWTVLLIVVYYDYNMFLYATGSVAPEQIEQYQKIRDEQKAKKEKMLSGDEKVFKEKNINTRTILKEGNPPDTIVKVAQEKDLTCKFANNKCGRETS